MDLFEIPRARKAVAAISGCLTRSSSARDGRPARAVAMSTVGGEVLAVNDCGMRGGRSGAPATSCRACELHHYHTYQSLGQLLELGHSAKLSNYLFDLIPFDSTS